MPLSVAARPCSSGGKRKIGAVCGREIGQIGFRGTQIDHSRTQSRERERDGAPGWIDSSDEAPPPPVKPLLFRPLDVVSPSPSRQQPSCPLRPLSVQATRAPDRARSARRRPPPVANPFFLFSSRFGLRVLLPVAVGLLLLGCCCWAKLD